MRTSAALLAMPLAAASASVAFAGSEQAFDNRQPSLALALVTPTFGSFPDGSATKAEGATLGFVYDFAGAFVPGGALAANGQSFSFSSNPVLETVFAGAFGGDFDHVNLPNLVGRAIVGAGGDRSLGSAIGSASVTLTPSQVPGAERICRRPTVQHSSAVVGVDAVDRSQWRFSADHRLIGNVGLRRSNRQLRRNGHFQWQPIPGGLAAGRRPIASDSANSPRFSRRSGRPTAGTEQPTSLCPTLSDGSPLERTLANPLGSTKGSNDVFVNRAELPGPGNSRLATISRRWRSLILIATTGIVPSPFFVLVQ